MNKDRSSPEMIYLDSAATTRMHPEVLERMGSDLARHFANPSSLHRMGLDAENLVNRSRRIAARILEIPFRRVFFTSGATESNNWAIECAWQARRRRGKTLVASRTCHPSVTAKLESMEARGATVRWIPTDGEGRLDGAHLERTLDRDVIFFSLLWINNETGVIQPAEKILSLVRAKSPDALTLVDAVQGFAKFDWVRMPTDADFLSLSAHKIGGPKGSGALCTAKNVPMTPLIHGGGQENRLRGGTENVPGIHGLGIAAALMERNRLHDLKNVECCRDTFETRISGEISGARINGKGARRSPYITSLSLKGIRGEVLVHALADRGVICSTGAACSSRVKPSASSVLKAMGVGPNFLEGSVRVSYFSDLEISRIENAADRFVETVRSLRRD